MGWKIGDEQQLVEATAHSGRYADARDFMRGALGELELRDEFESPALKAAWWKVCAISIGLMATPSNGSQISFRPMGLSLLSFLAGHLDQSFVCKCLARVGFQVAFEFQGPAFVFAGAIKLDLPRCKFGGMRTATLVMGFKPLLKIRREANIGLFRLAFAPKNINVKHARASFRFAQLRRARFASRSQTLTVIDGLYPQRGLPRVAHRAKRGGGGGN